MCDLKSPNMANSRKVCSVNPMTTIPRPTIQWEPGSYSIEDIVKTRDLPVVVQCDTTHCSTSLNSMNFDVTQPLLLYDYRPNDVRTMASNVVYDKTSKTFREVGDTMMIPRHYKGQFILRQHYRYKIIIDAHYKDEFIIRQHYKGEFIICQH